MNALLLRYSWAVVLGAGLVAFVVAWIGTRSWLIESSGIILPSQSKGHLSVMSLPASSPAAIVLTAPSTDKNISDWLATWCAESHGSAKEMDRDQRQAAGLLKYLAHTSLDGQTTFKVGNVLASDGRKYDKPIGEYFFETAMSKVLAGLADRTPPDKAADQFVNLLWASEGFNSGVGNWPTRLPIYGALTLWEPFGTPRQYRARLKHADLLILNDRPEEALTELAALAADTETGVYGETNPKDIAEVYWFAYLKAGRCREGLDYLRALIHKYQGKSDEQRLTGILIYAMAQGGDIDEAHLALDKWLKTNNGTLSKSAIDYVRLRIRLGEQMARNAATTRAASVAK